MRNTLKYYIYGIHSVIAALKNPKRKIIKVMCNRKVFNEYESIIKIHKHHIVDSDVLNNFIKENHQGIIAIVLTIFTNTLDKDKILSYNKIIILDQLTNVQNIGSIIRNAVAFNFQCVIMPNSNTPNENAAMAKVASGGLDMIDIIQVPNLINLIKFLKKTNFWIIGFDKNSNQYLQSTKIYDKIALIFGSEHNGLRTLTKNHCDLLLKIPISNIESLNVASTSAISCYILSSLIK